MGYIVILINLLANNKTNQAINYIEEKIYGKILMYILIVGLLIFYIPHAGPVFFPSFRQKAVDVLGLSRWRITYSIASVSGIIFIIWGWIVYRPIAPDIYYPPIWASYIALLLVWAGFVLFLVTKKQPGYILQIFKNPMMSGTLFWAIAHLIVNGDLASILVFGSFLIYAIASLIFNAIKGNVKYKFVSYQSDISALSFGTIIYVVFGFWVHGWLFGVTPF